MGMLVAVKPLKPDLRLYTLGDCRRQYKAVDCFFLQFRSVMVWKYFSKLISVVELILLFCVAAV